MGSRLLHPGSTFSYRGYNYNQRNDLHQYTLWKGGRNNGEHSHKRKTEAKD